MFKRGDFKKLELLGSGKKNTKIFKVEHIPTKKLYALKEVEAKSLDKLNEYKVNFILFFRKKLYSCPRLKIIQISSNSMDITSMKHLTTHSSSELSANISMNKTI